MIVFEQGTFKEYRLLAQILLVIYFIWLGVIGLNYGIETTVVLAPMLFIRVMIASYIIVGLHKLWKKIF